MCVAQSRRKEDAGGRATRVPLTQAMLGWVVLCRDVRKLLKDKEEPPKRSCTPTTGWEEVLSSTYYRSKSRNSHCHHGDSQMRASVEQAALDWAADGNNLFGPQNLTTPQTMHFFRQIIYFSHSKTNSVNLTVHILPSKLTMFDIQIMILLNITRHAEENKHVIETYN